MENKDANGADNTSDDAKNSKQMQRKVGRQKAKEREKYVNATITTKSNDVRLPKQFSGLAAAAARWKEIETLKLTFHRQRGIKLAFQKIPNHMRRRVMAHAVKRLPRNLRAIHQNQLKKSGFVKQPKRPSRKHRRRPGNLLAERARRQRRVQWLDTHIWHAKRFHMIERWGYRLPHRRCDKMFRALHRAATKHCMLQDLSYFSAVELAGEKTTLVERLKTLYDCGNGGLNIDARIYITGAREGTKTFYNLAKQPIGDVSFHWEAASNDKSDKRKIWFWLHPAFYQEFVDVLVQCFKLSQIEDGRWMNKDITLTSLKHKLCRFRLTGPLSTSVLQQALKIQDPNTSKSDWLQRHLANDDSRQFYAEQCAYWRSIATISSPGILSPNLILSLIVQDPRFQTPTKRTKAKVVACNNDAAYAPLPGANLAASALWQEGVRAEVSEKALSNKDVEQLRAQCVIADDMDGGIAVPMLVVQRPGDRESGYASGWDVIVPSCYAQPLWICLGMWGARAGGLKELDYVNFELGHADQLRPDTRAGLEFDQTLYEEATRRYFRLPPNKRPNYNKLAIAAPYRYEWERLVNDWRHNKKVVKDGDKNAATITVLRNVKLLQNIKDYIINSGKSSLNLSDIRNRNYLIPVRLRLLNGTLLRRCSIICLPRGGDDAGKNNNNNSKLPSPLQEENVRDANQAKRKELRAAHKTLLQRLKRRRRVARKRREPVKESDVADLKAYQTQMRALWLPAVGKTIRHSCQRPVIGFVTMCDYSLRRGDTYAVGYIVADALPQFAELKRRRVLVRNTISTHYQWAHIDVAY